MIVASKTCKGWHSHQEMGRSIADADGFLPMSGVGRSRLSPRACRCWAWAARRCLLRQSEPLAALIGPRGASQAQVCAGHQQ